MVGPSVNGSSKRMVQQSLFGPLAGCHGARRATYRIVYRIEESNRPTHSLRSPALFGLGQRDEFAQERPSGRCVEPVVEAVRHAGLVGLQRDDSDEHVAAAGVEEDRAA